MTVTIDLATANAIDDLGQNIVDEMQLKVAEIGLSLGAPVVWTDTERLAIMKHITLIAYLLALDLACYPLSDAAVVFAP